MSTLRTIPFRGESFFEQSIRMALVQLCSQPIEAVESEVLEIKSWCADEKDLAKELSEAAICLANANGGTVICGLQENRDKGRKFSACPYPNV